MFVILNLFQDPFCRSNRRPRS